MRTLVYVGGYKGIGVCQILQEKSFDRIFVFEPVPDQAEHIRQLLAFHPGVTVVEAACAASDGESNFHLTNNYNAIASLGRLKSDFSNDLYHTATIRVKIVHLGNYLHSHGVTTIDMYVSYAQGMDLAILRTLTAYLKNQCIGCIQTKTTKDEFMNIYNDVPSNNLTAFREFLDPFGYEMIGSGWGFLKPGEFVPTPDGCWEFDALWAPGGMTLKVCFNNLWNGFDTCSDPVNKTFFIDLLQRVLCCNVQEGSMEESHILFESIFAPSLLHARPWIMTILFSGESRIFDYYSEYSCVLYQHRNKGNVVNCPLFVPYLYCSQQLKKLENIHLHKWTTVPLCNTKDILTIISNGTSSIRNKILDNLEAHFPCVHAGKYRNNTNALLDCPYGSPQFIELVKQHRFILTCENSQEDTYITEKICHAMMARTVPIYWGSAHIPDYFNPDRMIIIDPNHPTPAIEKIKHLMNNDRAWLDVVNQPVFAFTNGCEKMWRTIDDIARDMRNVLLQQRGLFPYISQVYAICNDEFEPERKASMDQIFLDLALPDYMTTFMCPTYKHLITKDIMSSLVQSPHLLPQLYGRFVPMRRSEISLFLNFKAVLKDIEKRYLDGMFIILESDVQPKENVRDMPQLFKLLKDHQEEWELVHFGQGFESELYEGGRSEPFTKQGDPIRVIQMPHIRCTDTLLVNMRGVKMLLQELQEHDDYSVPLDCYIDQYIQKNQQFRCFWTFDSYFVQSSLHQGIKSNIQEDLS